MPFRLTGAPATFQRLIDRVIMPEMRLNVFSYLDDITVVTKTFDKHLSGLGMVLDRVVEAGLTINREESEFCYSEVRHLVFVVNQDGLQVDPDKVEPITFYRTPRTVEQFCRFMGISSRYRRFIAKFATMDEPLTQLFRTNTKWHWCEKQQEAFDSLKRVLTGAPILTHPSFKTVFENPFNLQTQTLLIWRLS